MYYSKPNQTNLSSTTNIYVLPTQIMNCTKPVSYLTLKCLLKHLDAGLRIQLSTICASIHNLEKSMPLDIKHLEITDDHIKVNRSTFKFSIYNGNSNRFILEINENERLELSGVEQDPLRIDIRRVPEMEEIATLESAIHSLKLKLSTQTTRNAYEDSRFLARLEAKLDRIYKKKYYNLSGVKYILLKIGGRIEVLCNQRNIHEALEYLLEKLFGGKIVNVDTLGFGWKASFQAPPIVKLRVANLHLPIELPYKAMDIVKLLIEDSSLPLNAVKSSFESIRAVKYHPIVKTAKMLKLRSPKHDFYILFLWMFHHRRVHLTNISVRNISLFLQMVNHWMSGREDISTNYTFQLSSKLIDKVMKSIRSEFETRPQAIFTHNTITLTRDTDIRSNLVISKMQQGSSRILGLKIESPRALLI